MITINHVQLEFISERSRVKNAGYFTRSVFLEKEETRRGQKIRKTTIIVHFFDHLNSTFQILNEYRVSGIEQIIDRDGNIANFENWEKRVAETVASIHSNLDLSTNDWIEGLIVNTGFPDEIEFLPWQHFLELDLALETSESESLVN